ncbi:MAG: sulfate adenylyltransferase [Butyrivibrio sp.]|nr:sulfate adenylyltransferase [Butyrivibrio sp.]
MSNQQKRTSTAGESGRGLLKFITCGSVDDGKSTLIGHILYDAKLLYADQERALQMDSKVGSRGGAIDYSLLLDGLTEEREQGITIDVAYRYFTTDHRSFIVADTPGHEEYTRNMAVGASFASLAVILVDAEKGVLVQTRRHARICAFMGIRHFVFAVNKMDLVDFNEATFRRIEEEIHTLSRELSLAEVKVIPVSATEGDNVTKRSDRMSWYRGDILLSWLEQVDVDDERTETGFYLPVQRVCRPDHTFRGFQGQIEAGTVRLGDELTALPGGERARVKIILLGDQEVTEAHAGDPVTIQLNREIDVSRGCVLERDAGLQTADAVTATILWMDDVPLQNGRNFYIMIGEQLIPGMIARILYAIDVNTGQHKDTESLSKNEIAVCRLVFTDRVVADRFRRHRTLGELILIDRISFQTSACGVVEQLEQGGAWHDGIVSGQTRSAALGQHAVTVAFAGDRCGVDRSLLETVERQLIVSGRHTYLYAPEADTPPEIVCAVAHHLMDAGLVVLLWIPTARQLHCAEADRSQLVVFEEKEKDAAGITAFVRRVSDYDAQLVREGGYI